MAEQTYSLIPFPDLNTPAIQIAASVRRENGVLNIKYILTGKTGKIRLPEISAFPIRKDGLWASTCFEFFLAHPGDPHYWEFNLSPSRDWNIYYMDAYRRVGFREEQSIQQMQLDVEDEADHISLTAHVDLSPLIADGQRVQLGISSVVQHVDQHQTYWALAHPYVEPDFHRRESFIVQL